MISEIAAKKDELTQLCLVYGVQRLELFGSAARGDFQSERSDLDFLVGFHPGTPVEMADRYLGLLEALERLFQRPVDLVMTEAISNPYFKEGVDRTRDLLYAA